METFTDNMLHKKVCIIILSYNNISDTVECLESVNHLSGGPYTVYLVDNASQDNTLEIVETRFPRTHLIALKKNLGFAAGINKGLEKALLDGFDLVFILNNDTVLDPNMMVELLAVADMDNQCGIVMPRIAYYPPQIGDYSRLRIWSDGGYFRKFPPTIKLKDDRNKIDFEVPRLIDYAPFCGVLIHKRAFSRVGLLDPTFFFFYEDWDFCERVQKAGLNIWIAPKAILWHKVSKTIKQDFHFYWHVMGESAMIFFKRHYSFLSAFVQLTYLILRDFVFNIKNIVYLKDYLMGLWHGFNQEASDIPTIDHL